MGATTLFNPLGLSPYSGVNVNPFLMPQLAGQSAQPLQQIQQVLQTIPYQLQQWQQLVSAQQYQLQQLQQVLQVIPAQLAQLQQIIHLTQGPQQQQQPFASAGISTLPLWSTQPQTFGAQPTHLM